MSSSTIFIIGVLLFCTAVFGLIIAWLMHKTKQLEQQMAEMFHEAEELTSDMIYELELVHAELDGVMSSTVEHATKAHILAFEARRDGTSALQTT